MWPRATPLAIVPTGYLLTKELGLLHTTGGKAMRGTDSHPVYGPEALGKLRRELDLLLCQRTYDRRRGTEDRRLTERIEETDRRFREGCESRPDLRLSDIEGITLMKFKIGDLVAPIDYPEKRGVVVGNEAGFPLVKWDEGVVVDGTPNPISEAPGDLVMVKP